MDIRTRMNKEELRQNLLNCSVVVDDALEELIREAQDNTSIYEMLTEMYYVRPPKEIKKQIKYEKNPMRLKQLNRELNDSYKVYRRQGFNEN